MAKQKVNKSGNQRGLHRKGSKNLKKTEGGYENIHGVVFTTQEKKDLESKVNSAMSKRRRILKDRNNDIRTILGVPQDYTVGEDFQSNSFLMTKKSKSIQQFKTRKQYETYMKNLENVNKRDYIDKKLNQYKENYINSINKTFGSDGENASAKIKNMSIKQFAKLMNSELYAGIQYIYSPEDYQTKVEAINLITGVK